MLGKRVGDEESRLLCYGIYRIVVNIMKMLNSVGVFVFNLCMPAYFVKCFAPKNDEKISQYLCTVWMADVVIFWKLNNTYYKYNDQCLPRQTNNQGDITLFIRHTVCGEIDFFEYKERLL